MLPSTTMNCLLPLVFTPAEGWGVGSVGRGVSGVLGGVCVGGGGGQQHSEQGKQGTNACGPIKLSLVQPQVHGVIRHQKLPAGVWGSMWY
jgi:hypothetical protein